MAEGTPPDVKKNLDRINVQIVDGEPDAVAIEGPPPKGKPFIQGEPMQQLAYTARVYQPAPKADQDQTVKVTPKEDRDREQNTRSRDRDIRQRKRSESDSESDEEGRDREPRDTDRDEEPRDTKLTPTHIQKHVDLINSIKVEGEPDAVAIEGPPPKGKPFIQGEPMQQLAHTARVYQPAPKADQDQTVKVTPKEDRDREQNTRSRDRDIRQRKRSERDLERDAEGRDREPRDTDRDEEPRDTDRDEEPRDREPY